MYGLRAGQEAKLCVPLGLRCTDARVGGLCFGDCPVYGSDCVNGLTWKVPFNIGDGYTIAGTLGNVRHLLYWVIMVFKALLRTSPNKFLHIQHDSMRRIVRFKDIFEILESTVSRIWMIHSLDIGPVPGMTPSHLPVNNSNDPIASDKIIRQVRQHGQLTDTGRADSFILTHMAGSREPYRSKGKSR